MSCFADNADLNLGYLSLTFALVLKQKRRKNNCSCCLFHLRQLFQMLFVFIKRYSNMHVLAKHLANKCIFKYLLVQMLFVFMSCFADNTCCNPTCCNCSLLGYCQFMHPSISFVLIFFFSLALPIYLFQTMQNWTNITSMFFYC